MGSNKKRKSKNKNKGDIETIDVINTVSENTEDEAGADDAPTDSLPRTTLTVDSDSDEEKVPKKKKKRNVQQQSTDTQKKGNKSKRQLKKEKFAQRQAEAQAQSKDQLKSQCLNYLSQWKHNRQGWKFMKIKQGWLYKNKFSPNLIPDASWPVLLEYFESAQGNIKSMLLEDSNKIMKQMDDWTESQSKDNADDETSDVIKPDVVAYKRARDLIQCLQE